MKRTALIAAATMAVLAAPANAGQVIVVGKDGAKRVNDPAVPTQAEIALGMPVGGRSPVGLASRAATASRARASTAVRARAASKRGRRAVYASLRRELRRGRISRAEYRRWRATHVRSVRTLRRLRGARASQLAYVLGSVESLALRRRLGATRMPAAFVQLERNRRYWPRMRYPGAGDQVSFRGSEILYQYFPGQGLQLHPLATFKKANAMYGFCNRGESACDEAGHKRLLDEMGRLAVRRSRRFVAWEYMFHFGGGAPPWMSGMAQATGVQALGRAASIWNEPNYVGIAERALGAFSARPPLGVRTTGPRGGIHYLQYSFAPRLFIFNGYLQTLIGLYDFSNLAESERARALYAQSIDEGRAEVPLSDVGDWSLYSYAGAESSRDYHELLREFLESLCTRRQGAVFCEYARKYRGYQVDPPEISYEGPLTATEDEPVSLRFSLSKLSAVQITVTRPDGRVVLDRLATFRRGNGSFIWTPRGPSTFRVRVAAKELRTGMGKRDSDSALIEVANRAG